MLDTKFWPHEMPVFHELKTWTDYFNEVWNGSKTFEIRENDREYCKGDLLLLKDYDKFKKTYEARRIIAEVTYITDYAQKDNYVVLAIKVLHKCEERLLHVLKPVEETEKDN